MSICDISEEVQEQVMAENRVPNESTCDFHLTLFFMDVLAADGISQLELVRTQLRRAKGRPSSPDEQLSMDLSWALAENGRDLGTLRRISEKLQLTTMNDLKKETIALHEMVIESADEVVDCLEEMSSLLKQLTDWISSSPPGGAAAPEGRGHPSGHRYPVVPDDFWCPISREIMRDPVTVSTGQVWPSLHRLLPLHFSGFLPGLADPPSTSNLVADVREIQHPEMAGCGSQDLPQNAAATLPHIAHPELPPEEPHLAVVPEQRPPFPQEPGRRSLRPGGRRRARGEAA